MDGSLAFDIVHYSFELVPPKKEELLEDWVRDIIPKIRGIFDVVTIVDKATRHDPIETAIALRENFQGEIIPHLTLQDRTRKDFKKMIAAMRAADITQILALKGDTLPSGEVKDVCELIALGRENNLTVGVAINQRSDPPERTQQKIAVGATFFITQPVWNENELDNMLRAKLFTLVPTLLVLRDHKKLAKYASQYPDMGIPKNYLNNHAREGTPLALTYARQLKQKLEARGFTWLHFMGDLDLLLNLF